MDGSAAGVTALHKTLSDAGVKYMLSGFVDMHGIPKGKMVPIGHLAQMMAGSELYTGAALDGVPQDVSDEEVASHPDPASCIVLPWQPDVAWFASNLYCEGRPFPACSRTVLKRQTARLADRGWQLNLGMEAEFFVLRDDPDAPLGYAPLSRRRHLDKPCYDAVRLLDNLDWVDELVDAMNRLGWDVYSFDHEDGIGQFEIDFAYADAVTMADRYVFLRMMAHAIAARHGGFASFMPKPFADRAGSGAHYNMSIARREGGDNLFFDPDDPRGCKLSKLGYSFIAGVLAHIPAIMAVVAPSVNSYKRLVKQGSMSGSTWAPIYRCYGNNNRTNSLRVPRAGGRVELRPADSCCNPYLGAAMVLAAGLEGIEQELDPGEPRRENMYLKSDAELAAMGVDLLPRTLGEALQAFRADPLSRAVFGDALFESWLAYKEDEWLGYLNHVSDWEVARYLKMF